MRLLNGQSALLLAALACPTVLASTAPVSTAASPTPPISDSNDVQFAAYWPPVSTMNRLALPTPETDPQSDSEHDLLRREVVTGPAAAQPTGAGQISPITTYQVNQIVNGVAQQVQEVYTQLFSAVPIQGLAPASGAIGLGTIQGQIGVVQTGRKRDAKPEPTAVADVPLERRVPEEETSVRNAVLEERNEGLQTLERRSLAGKVDANSAGSALALLVAITVMVVV